MEIEIFADGIKRKDCINLPIRRASRGIWLHDGKIMILYMRNLDVFMFPGGGVNPEESLEDCLKREIKEETGYCVISASKRATITEYFPEAVFQNTYFWMEADLNQVHPQLTEEEQKQGLEIQWYTLDDLLTLLGEYESTHEYGENIHYREFLALTNSI